MLPSKLFPRLLSQIPIMGWALGVLFLSLITTQGVAQSFGQTNLDYNGFDGVEQGTSLMFGPDGRLYVVSLKGQIDIYTIERIQTGVDAETGDPIFGYQVIDAEELLTVLQHPNHNDDGTSTGTTQREATGLTVAGTAIEPVIYVTSSDPRVGGPSGDQDLDTNSGVITRIAWNSVTLQWDIVDLVRGLPRSEENHATNGLEYVEIGNVPYLIVCSGGHDNAGGPSDNFAWTNEYALSAAILAVNLNQINALPILTDQTSNRSYIYDIPTLDDPSRTNVNGIADPNDPMYNGIDMGDPWGGNDGLNQAKIVMGGPVQIFSGGYRNTYDLTVTADGKVYATDNGANGGWGGLPANEGLDGTVTNDYNITFDNNGDVIEIGSSSPTADGEQVNNQDHLTMITDDIQSYTFGSFYGGHPVPTRANPVGAGLFTNPEKNNYNPATSVFRTQTYDPDGSTPGSTTDPSIALPADWPAVPVSMADVREGDWRGPGINNPDGPNDDIITTWGTNTNGIDEYTASNFNGAMQGDLIAGKNGGVLRRVQLNPDGTLQQLTSTFQSNLGGNALGITCNSDSDPFPGTIWVATFNGTVKVLEPQDFVICILPGESGYDANADNDSDGYTNQDEIDNILSDQTIEGIICNGGAQPNDFDKTAGGILVSDLNDSDDDADGILDANDPFQLGDPLTSGNDAFNLPVLNELFSDNLELKGYFGLGFTGLMNNGDANPNWLNWLDRRDDPNDPNPNDLLGGAVGAMTMQMTSGTALGNSNTQEKGFQYGVNVDQNTGMFTVEGSMLNFTDPLQLYGNQAPTGGELGIFIGDGTQSNYIKAVINQSGIQILQEINDIPQTPINVPIATGNRPANNVKFQFVVDPTTGGITVNYALEGGAFQSAGSLTAQGTILNAIQNNNTPLAVGLIGTSNQVGTEVEATWDYLNVQGAAPTIEQTLADIDELIDATAQTFDLDAYFNDDNGDGNLTYSVEGNTDNSIGASVASNILTITFPSTPATSDIIIRATDQDNLFVEQTFTVTVSDEPVPILRIRATGATIAALDAPNPDWISAGGVGAQSGTFNGISYAVNTGNTSTHNITGRDASVPAYVPQSLFAQERWDPPAAPEMEWTFDLPNGNYFVRLYMGNGFGGTSGVGERVFDISIEGQLAQNDMDLSATFGHQTGGMLEYPVTLTDGTINILFEHVVENPTVNGIEILQVGGSFQVPIVVNDPGVQDNFENDAVSLQIGASGGAGSLTYGATGLPAGLTINQSTGLISGTIADGAAANSPYTTIVTVGDGGTSTPATATFTWNVSPFEITNPGPQAAFEGNPINLQLLTAGGNAPYVFGATGLPTGLSIDNSGLISGTIAAGAATNSPYTVVINATDADSDPATTTFTFNVNVLGNGEVLFRVNNGGATIAATDAPNPDWDADSGNFGAAGNSPYLAALSTGTSTFVNTSGSAYPGPVDVSDPSIPAGTPATLFNAERYDAASAPEMKWEFPIPVGTTVELRLYFAEIFNGIDAAGERVFDINVEGTVPPVFDDVDPFAIAGANAGFMLSDQVTVTDGTLDIEFIHGVENPSIKGIEIVSVGEPTNNPPVVQAIPNQTNTEGDLINLSVIADDGDGNTQGIMFGAVGLPAGIQIEPTTGLIFGNIAAGAATNSPYTVDVTVTDGGTPALATTVSFDWTVNAPTNDVPQAFLQILPGGGLGGSTFGGTEAFQLENQSTGTLQITSISIDLSTGILPDMVFDPTGTGGDATAQCFNPDGSEGTTVGLIPFTSNCVDPFSQARQGGFDIITVNFNDFDPGEVFSWSVDIDPNSIQGVPGAGGAGSVSGYELVGATVTITFSDETTLVSSLYEEGSLGGGEVVVAESAPATPSISVVGVGTGPATVGSLSQMVTVTGTPGDYVSLLLMDSEMTTVNPFNVPDETYYANTALSGKTLYTGQITGNGSVDIPITLFSTGAINQLMAVTSAAPYATGTQVSQTSNLITLLYDPNAQMASLTATANLQGRGDYSGTYTLDLYNPGETGTPVYTFTTTAGANGEMTVTGMMPGTYDVWIITEKYISRMEEDVVLASGSNSVSFLISNDRELRAGDANDDNQISAVDFSILASTFNLSSGDAQYDDRADFNGDDAISALDFSLLASNFNTSGELPGLLDLEERNEEFGILETETVSLFLEEVEEDVTVRNTFRVALKVESGVQLIDAAEAHLTFNPTLLQVQNIELGDKFDISLAANYDNKAGQINIASGSLTSLFGGETTVAYITFKTMHKGQASIDFADDKGAALVTYLGENLVDQVNGAAVNIVGEKMSLYAFPNPTAGLITLQVINPENAEATTVRIFTAEGRQVLTQQFKGNINERFDLSKEAPGLYFFEVTSGAETMKKSIVLE